MSDDYKELIQISKEDLFQLLYAMGSTHTINEYSEKYDFTVREYDEWWENEC